MVQGAEDTGDSGLKCIIVKGRGEESIGGVQLFHGARFPQTVTKDADDITVEHFVLVQEEVDVESFKVVRQITHLNTPK